MKAYSDFEQLKWTILDHAGANIKIGIGSAVARQIYPAATDEELNELVRRALLELYDEGLVAVFRASEDEAYNVKIDDVAHLDREEVVNELSRAPDYVDPPDQIPFIRETKKGAEVFAQLPPGAVWAGHE